MYTESYIRELPAPSTGSDARRCTEAEWLRLIRSSDAAVAMGLASRHPLTSRQVTRARTSSNRYETNYLFYSPDAELLVQVPGGVSSVVPGSLVWFPPGTPYSLYASGDLAGKRLYRFRFTVAENGMQASPWNKEEVFPGLTWYPDFLDRVIREMAMPDCHTDEQNRALLLQFTVRLFRMRREASGEGAALSVGRLRDLHAYVMDHIGKRPAPSELAAVAGLSPAYFTRVFVKAMGMAPRRWILEQRIRYSTHLLLESSANVSEIAYSLGYDEPRLYTRQFASVYNMSPTEYRRRM